ncbi:MAG: cell division protein FtsA [Candidatus Omnitrophota bacterium]
MMRERIYCGLDLGSQSIKSSAVKTRSGGHAEILGVHESPTVGLKKTSIADLNELSEAIHQNLKNLAKKINLKIKDIQLGIGGHFIESRYSHAVVPLLDKGGKAITRGDIRNVNQHARLLGIKMEEEMLHDFPQNYTVDDIINTSSDPLGLYGRKLGVNSLLIFTKVALASNIIRAVNQVGFEASRMTFSSLCCAQHVLNKKSRNDGCIFIDVGASTADILIFKDNVLRQIDIIHLGGDHVTKNIAQSLNLPFDLAEDIKKSYAVALADDAKKTGEILIKRDANYMPIRREKIYEAIEPEITKLVNAISNTIQSSGLSDKLAGGIVVGGGGALLPGFIERVEETTKMASMMGRIGAAASGVNNAVVFGAAISLAQGATSRLADFSVSPQPRGHVKNVFHRIRELYEEYF